MRRRGSRGGSFRPAASGRAAFSAACGRCRPRGRRLIAGSVLQSKRSEPSSHAAIRAMPPKRAGVTRAGDAARTVQGWKRRGRTARQARNRPPAGAAGRCLRHWARARTGRARPRIPAATRVEGGCPRHPARRGPRRAAAGPRRPPPPNLRRGELSEYPKGRPFRSATRRRRAVCGGAVATPGPPAPCYVKACRCRLAWGTRERRRRRACLSTLMSSHSTARPRSCRHYIILYYIILYYIILYYYYKHI